MTGISSSITSLLALSCFRPAVDALLTSPETQHVDCPLQLPGRWHGDDWLVGSCLVHFNVLSG